MSILRLLCVALALAAVVACGSKEDRRQGFYESAKKYVAEQKYEEAKIAVRNALKIDPKFAEGYELLGDLMLKERNLRQAFANYAKAVELNPALVSSQIGVGRIYALAGELDKAEQALKVILAQDPKNVQGQLIQATVLAKRKDSAKAREILQVLMADHPQEEEAAMLLADILQGEGQPDEAIGILQGAVDKVKNKDAVLIQLANIFLSRQRFQEAKEVYVRLAASHPEKPALRLLEANVLQQEGDTAGAIAILKDVIAKEPANAQYRSSLAKLHLANKDVKAAEETLTAAVKEIPKPYSLVEELAALYVSTGRIAEAKGLFETWLKDAKDDPERLDLRRRNAELLFATNQLDQSLAEVDAMLARTATDAKSLELRGRIFLRQNQSQKAITDLRQVVDQDPANLTARVLLAEAHMATKEPLQGVEQLEAALKKDPRFQPARQSLVRHHLRAREFDKARAQLATMDEQNPGQTSGRKLIAELYAQERNFDKALEVLGNLQKEFPDDPTYTASMGMVRLAMGDQDKAMARFEEALKKNPQFLPAVESMVRVHMARKEPAKALAFAAQKAAQHPDNVRLLFIKAALEHSQGQFDQAKKDYQAIIDKAPTWSQPYMNLVQAYIQSGDLTKGIERFKKSQAEHPDVPGFSYMLALLQQFGGQTDEAKANYRQTLQKSPKFGPAANNLAYLLASTSTSPEEMQEALSLAQQGAESGTPEALDTLGYVHLKLRNLDQAMEAFGKALEKSPENPTTNFHMAQAYLEKNDKDSARRHLDKALQSPLPFEDKEAAQKLMDSLG